MRKSTSDVMVIFPALNEVEGIVLMLGELREVLEYPCLDRDEGCGIRCFAE